MSSLRSQENTDELVVSDTARTTRPCHWPKEDLGKLFTLQLGKMLNKNARETVPKFPYLGNKDVQWGHFDFSDLREMHFDEQEREKFRLIPGDLLVCEGGEIGRTALWTGEFGCYYQKAIHRLRLQSPSKVDPRFILHFMRFAASHGLFADLTSQSSIAHLTREKLARLKVPLPSLLEQRRIAAILSSVDGAIEKTQAVIDQVQVVKRGLMQELLTRGVPGRHTRFKQTEIGEIPEDWRLFRIEQVGVVEAGRQRSPKAQGKPRPYLRVANVYDGYIDTTSLLSMPFLEPEFVRLKLVPGDLLLNEGQSKELVGRCAQYSGEPRDCCFQNTLIRFQAGEHIRARFAFWVFRHYFYSGVFSAIARQTTSVAHLGVSRFANLKLALPDIEEQAAIVEGLETLNAREEIERCRLSQLGIVKSSLMSVLLTGELRVILDGAVA